MQSRNILALFVGLLVPLLFAVSSHAISTEQLVAACQVAGQGCEYTVNQFDQQFCIVYDESTYYDAGSENNIFVSPYIWTGTARYTYVSMGPLNEPCPPPPCEVTWGWELDGQGGWECNMLTCGNDTDPTGNACGPPPEPDHCSNGINDGDENGVDCGGADCAAACLPACPTGSSLENREFIDIPGVFADLCISDTIVEMNSLGGCPDDYLVADGGVGCSQWDLPTQVSSEYFVDDGEQNYVLPYVPDLDPWNEADASNTTVTVVNSNSSDPDGTTYESETTETTTTEPDGTVHERKKVDTTVNPDGSSSVTTTTETTNSSGDGSSHGGTTIVVNNYDSEGGLTGSSESETTFESDEGGAPDGALGGAPTGGMDFQPLYDLKTELADRFPISLVTTAAHMLDGWVVSPAAPKWSLCFPNPFGSCIPFDIDLVIMDSVAVLVRRLLTIFIIVCGFYLVYKRWV